MNPLRRIGANDHTPSSESDLNSSLALRIVVSNSHRILNHPFDNFDKVLWCDIQIHHFVGIEIIAFRHQKSLIQGGAHFSISIVMSFTPCHWELDQLQLVAHRGRRESEPRKVRKTRKRKMTAFAHKACRMTAKKRLQPCLRKLWRG